MGILFNRFIGSEPGYEKSAALKPRNTAPAAPAACDTAPEPLADTVLIPQIRSGRIVGWTTLK